MVNLGPLGKNTFSLGTKEKFLNDWQEIHAKNHEFQSRLQLRLYYITRAICEEFNQNINITASEIYIFPNSELEYCNECGRNQFSQFEIIDELICIDKPPNFIELSFKYLTEPNNFYILWKDKPVQIGDHIPKKWIFNDFEDELKDCKQKYIDWKLSKEAQRKANKEFNKLTKKQLQDALKSKLSSEELALISFKK